MQVSPRTIFSLAHLSGEHYMGACTFQSRSSHKVTRSFQLEFTEEQKAGSSSTYRELVGIYEGVKDAAPGLRSQTLTVLTDNRAAEKTVNLGSMIKCQQDMAVRIWELASAHGIDLHVLWSRRSEAEGKLADEITRTWETGRSSYRTEFRIAAEDFDRIQRHCGIKCEVDVLSSHWSRRLPRFYAEFHTKGAEARDAFSHTWPVGTELWIHAETSQLLSIMEKARDQAAKGLLLTAYFPARADFVLFWEQQGPDLQLLIKSPFRFEAPAWRTNSCFNGLSAFDCCVFRFNYSGQ